MSAQTLGLKRHIHYNNLVEPIPSQKEVLGQTRKSESLDLDVERMSGSFQQVKAMEKPISRVLMTTILCMMMFGLHRALPTCF